MNKAVGELAKRYVEGASYPAQRNELAEYARAQGADESVIEALSAAVHSWQNTSSTYLPGRASNRSVSATLPGWTVLRFR